MAGFDWILLDAEHAPNDVLTLVPQLMALKDSVSAPVVRPPSNEVVVIKRLLDAGFHNFLIPFVESADEARRAVAATRYPPAGVRGVSVSQRSNRYGSVADYFKIVNDNIAVMVQIESRAGVAAAANIAAVDGVDGLFIGPSDLAAAFGQLGNAKHPEVQEAMTQGIRSGQGGRQADGHACAGRGRRAALPAKWAHPLSRSAATWAFCGWRHRRSTTSFARRMSPRSQLNTEPSFREYINASRIRRTRHHGIAHGGQPHQGRARAIPVQHSQPFRRRWSKWAARPARTAKRSRRRPTSSSRWCRIRRTSTRRCSAKTASRRD